MAKIRQVTLDIYYENEEIMELILKRKELDAKRKEVPEYEVPLVNGKLDEIDIKIAEIANLYIPNSLVRGRIVSNYIKDMGVI